MSSTREHFIKLTCVSMQPTTHGTIEMVLRVAHPNAFRKGGRVRIDSSGIIDPAHTIILGPIPYISTPIRVLSAVFGGWGQCTLLDWQWGSFYETPPAGDAVIYSSEEVEQPFLGQDKNGLITSGSFLEQMREKFAGCGPCLTFFTQYNSQDWDQGHPLEMSPLFRRITQLVDEHLLDCSECFELVSGLAARCAQRMRKEADNWLGYWKPTKSLNLDDREMWILGINSIMAIQGLGSLEVARKKAKA